MDVLLRIAAEKKTPRRAELSAQVLLACGLRKFEPIVRKEVEKMSFLIGPRVEPKVARKCCASEKDLKSWGGRILTCNSLREMFR
ncbi:MAG: hypothetical protein HYZ37_11665 [Candidatus Solibacter usitatus]|nr:hypothetical protein [Candidatus Solibacter usitatus]